ncbi:MAG: ABC transporter permease [Bacteroidaceae bacterium]|nr:ABC transporter permease [Bacteroidaceae bacterium]
MNLELFIAKRLYGTRKGEKRISRPAVAIAQWGIAIGAVIMIASICIIVGFKQQIRDKVFGFGGHIQISGYSNGGSEVPITADSIFLNALSSAGGTAKVQPYVQKTGMILANKEFEGVLIKGVGKEYDLTFLREHIIEGGIPEFSDTASSGKILISRSIADKTNSKLGDRLNVYFFDNGIKARKLTVAGIYRTHLTELDNAIAITDIYTTRSINNWTREQASAIEISIDDYRQLLPMRENIAGIAHKAGIRNSEGMSVLTIEEAYPSMFAWLNVLDQTVWIILILVLCIAAFTMISGLLILILEKSSLIGILKAIGSKDTSIRRIFIYYACFIIGKGLLIGNIIGISLCLLQQQFKIIAIDPEMYYMDRVPIEFTWLLIPMNIAIYILSVAALVLPSMLISKIEPTKAMKFE